MHRHKILLVDDVPADVYMLQGILGSDHHIVTTTCGLEALEIAGREKPDLILLDVAMPELDGYDVARRLKANPLTREIPIIFTAAPHEVQDEEIGLAAGGVDYITKPPHPSIVRARVSNHLELQKQRTTLSRLSTIDAVTGMPNRQGAEAALEQEWRRAAKNEKELSLLILDINDFGSHHETCVDEAGKERLRMVTAAIRFGIRRAADVVARYKGGRFLCILPRTDTDGAKLLAERVRETLAEFSQQQATAEKPGISITIGTCTCVPHPELSPETLLHAAEEKADHARTAGPGSIETGTLRLQPIPSPFLM